MPHPREHLATVAIAGAIYTIGGRVHGRDDEMLGGWPSDTPWNQIRGNRCPQCRIPAVASMERLPGIWPWLLGAKPAASSFADAQYLDTDGLTWDCCLIYPNLCMA